MRDRGKRPAAIAAILLAAVLALSACGHQDTVPTASPSSPTPQASAAAAFQPDSPPASSSSSPTTATSGASEQSDAAESAAAATPPASRQATEPPSPPKAADTQEGNNPAGAPAPSPSTTPSASAAHEAAATLSVVGNAEWGSILPEGKVALAKGDTAGDILLRTLKKHKLAFSVRGSGVMLYVEGIDGLFEFDDGPTSGWKFRVNGIDEDVGAGAYKVKPGDRIEWYYASEDKQAAEDGGQTP